MDIATSAVHHDLHDDLRRDAFRIERGDATRQQSHT
jgi:hypothetical protein